MQNKDKLNKVGSSADAEDVKVLESNLKTKHVHKSHQITNVSKNKDSVDTEQQLSKADESISQKPPVVKKRKKLLKKLPPLDTHDSASDNLRSVPLVEIKQPSLNKPLNVRQQEAENKVVVTKEAPVTSNIPLASMKYEQPRQFARSRPSYALPERMQRLRRTTGLSEPSTSPELSLSDTRGKENIDQISGYDFFVKEWFDNTTGKDSALVFISNSEPQIVSGAGERHSAGDGTQSRMTKTKRHKSLFKRTESVMDDTSVEMYQETQPLLGFVERSKQDLLIFGRSEYLSSQERIRIESKFLYDPPDTEVPLELKIGGKLPRYMEDEGFFIGKLPYVAPTNLRHLENRIINEVHMDVSGLKSINDYQSADNEILSGAVSDQEMEVRKRLKIQSWFREDGMLDLQPNPLKNIPSRPSLWNDQLNPLPEKLQIFYVHPLSPELTHNYFLSSSQADSLKSQHLSGSGLNLSRFGKTGAGTMDTDCRLDVDIRQIAFDFHPLFSLEHVHAQNLRQIVQIYELTLSRDQVNACIQRISALKRALRQLEGKRIANETTYSEEELLDIDYRIEDYYQEISLMRPLRAWKRIKETRKRSGCTNTTVRLKISKQLTNIEQDQLDWDNELDEIVKEAKHEFDGKFQQAQNKYDEELEIYKKEKRKQEAALRRQRLRESGQTGDMEDNAEVEREDAQVLAKKTLTNPPTKPKPFDSQFVRDEAEINLKKCRRLPNEPKITVSLAEDTVISSNNECPKMELNRRLKMLEYTYFIKLYYNGKLVATTQPQLLTHQFTLDFRWILPIQIRNQPESIVAKLFEKRGCHSHQITEFYITPPNYEEMRSSSAERSNIPLELDLQRLRFTITTGASLKLVQSSSNQNVSPSSASMSSFVGAQPKILLEELDGSGEKMVCIPITGTLYTTVKWVPTNYESADTIDIERNTGYLQNRSGYSRSSMKQYTANLQSFLYPATSFLHSIQMNQSNPLFLNDTLKSDERENFKTHRLDPNNTMDAKLLNLIQTVSGSHLLPSQVQNTTGPEVLFRTRAGGANYFHLDYLIERFNFCTDEDLDNSKRLRLLHLRQNRVPGFQNIIIPSFARHIPEDIFDSLNEKKDPDSYHGTLKGMKAYKQKHKMYIEKIKAEVNQHFQEALNKKSIREIVIEEEIPNILFLLPMLRRLFEPKRPLRPKHQERRRIGPQYVQDSYLELIVTIHGAYNLPIRCRKRRDQSDYGDKNGVKNDPLKPFVEIKFQQNKRSTIPSEGRNPCWNAEFRFSFILTPGISKLECMKDPIIINVYDQLTFSQTEGDQPESSNYIQHVEHRLIGSAEVPLSTVYLNSKISGKINLSIPLILQGYEVGNIVKSSIRPMIDVLMTLEPSIYPPAPLLDSFITMEPVSIQSTLSKWYQKLAKYKFMTDRQFKPLVMNSNCQEVLMTRFLRPLNPPEEFLPGMNTGLTVPESMLRLSRYVSLIPYESDAASFPGLAQVWCTCDQFLSMLCGDEEEHAVLLACYFMYVFQFSTVDSDNADTSNMQPSKKSSQAAVHPVYLCVGEAVPEGCTVYIMTEDFISHKQTLISPNWRLWNPSSTLCLGISQCRKYISQYTQKHEPWELIWDMNSTKNWLPVFSKSGITDNSNIPQTIQPNKLSYDILESREVDYIKFELETVLRDALMEWRKTKITRLNYEFIKDFNKMLESLEKNNGAYYDGLNQLLDRISLKYHMYGFPMNFSYMEPDEIIARVKSKGIHDLIGSEYAFSDIVDQAQQLQQQKSSVSFAKTTLNGFSDSIFNQKPSIASIRRLQSDSLNVQFALNVYVKAYPGPVLSIWIYLAALWRRTPTELQ
ncbi:unnamed protein product [Heterobilharzia americana]|nr:unnamed protein product [Heterobilharzia americana]